MPKKKFLNSNNISTRNNILSNNNIFSNNEKSNSNNKSNDNNNNLRRSNRLFKKSKKSNDEFNETEESHSDMIESSFEAINPISSIYETTITEIAEVNTPTPKKQKKTKLFTDSNEASIESNDGIFSLSTTQG